MRAWLFALSVLIAGCGGNSAVDICKKDCEKSGSCTPGATQGSILDCKNACPETVKQFDNCSNIGQIESCFNDCPNRASCVDYRACQVGCPQCVR